MKKAIISTGKGDIAIELFDKDAPNTVAVPLTRLPKFVCRKRRVHMELYLECRLDDFIYPKPIRWHGGYEYNNNISLGAVYDFGAQSVIFSGDNSQPDDGNYCRAKRKPSVSVDYRFYLNKFGLWSSRGPVSPHIGR